MKNKKFLLFLSFVYSEKSKISIRTSENELKIDTAIKLHKNNK